MKIVVGVDILIACISTQLTLKNENAATVCALIKRITPKNVLKPPLNTAGPIVRKASCALSVLEPFLLSIKARPVKQERKLEILNLKKTRQNILQI